MPVRSQNLLLAYNIITIICLKTGWLHLTLYLIFKNSNNVIIIVTSTFKKIIHIFYDVTGNN